MACTWPEIFILNYNLNISRMSGDINRTTPQRGGDSLVFIIP
jgi:hypothetical protein